MSITEDAAIRIDHSSAECVHLNPQRDAPYQAVTFQGYTSPDEEPSSHNIGLPRLEVHRESTQCPRTVRTHPQGVNSKVWSSRDGGGQFHPSLTLITNPPAGSISRLLLPIQARHHTGRVVCTIRSHGLRLSHTVLNLAENGRLLLRRIQVHGPPSGTHYRCSPKLLLAPQSNYGNTYVPATGTGMGVAQERSPVSTPMRRPGYVCPSQPIS